MPNLESLKPQIEELFRKLPERYRQIGVVLAFVPAKHVRRHANIQTAQTIQRTRLYSEWCSAVRYYFENKDKILEDLQKTYQPSKVARIEAIIGLMLCSSDEIGVELGMSGAALRKFVARFMSDKHHARETTVFFHKMRKVVFGKSYKCRDRKTIGKDSLA